jgi:hypothetical protein
MAASLMEGEFAGEDRKVTDNGWSNTEIFAGYMHPIKIVCQEMTAYTTFNRMGYSQEHHSICPSASVTEVTFFSLLM